MSSRPADLPPMSWQLASPIPAQLQLELSHIHPVLRQILYNRGLDSRAAADAFLNGVLIYPDDPFLLADMDKAVARIARAIADEEMIAVYGDFDADGVTSTVLLTEALRGMGLEYAQVRPYIPDRVDEGYGLNEDALTFLRDRGASLVITVDCGIRSVREVAHAHAIGLDVIITDHHSLGPRLPEALAVINPRRPDSNYPDLDLAGVGIAYKLAQALHQALPVRDGRFDPRQLLDLVAIGTVADLAPLRGENRQLVTAGLAVLNNTMRPGVAALAQIARLPVNRLTAESIAFGIGPRINAAGRLDHAYTAARLLAVNNSLEARQLAQELNRLNVQRQRLTAELTTHAEQLIDPDDMILIAADSAFQSGVVGLVASRLADKHYRPAIVIEQGDAESRGSCRSIGEFHITDALDQVAELLVRHGGHRQAAGFTIENENLSEFAARMQAIASEQLAGLTLQRTIVVDAELRLDELDWALYELLATLEPTGYANPTPVFMSRGLQVVSHRAVGHDGSHLQLQLGDERRPFAAIAFRQGSWIDQMPDFVDVVYTLNVNEWNGRRSLQLMVQDIRPAENQ